MGSQESGVAAEERQAAIKERLEQMEERVEAKQEREERRKRREESRREQNCTAPFEESINSDSEEKDQSFGMVVTGILPCNP